MKELNIYLMTSCTGVRQRSGYYISLVEWKTTKGPATKQWIRKAQGTSRYEIELTGFLVVLEAIKEPCALSIYADSSHIVNALNNRWVDAWIENGWKNAKGKQISHKEMWLKVLNLLKEHEFRICKKTDHEYGEWMQRKLKEIMQEETR